MRFSVILVLILFSVSAFPQDKETAAYSLGVKGIQLVDEGNYKEGIQFLKEARNLDPTDYDYSFEIGRAYFLSGNPKKAERYVYDLQFHVAATQDLYVLLAKCYRELEKLKKEPDVKRKKELKSYLSGIEKLPNSGLLYTELGKLYLELEDPSSALAIWELGLKKDPNFAENYYWASKLLDRSGNSIWAWLYGEVFLNMSDDQSLVRALAPIVYSNSKKVFSAESSSSPEKLGQLMGLTIQENCGSEQSENELLKQVEIRSCLLKHFIDRPESIVPLMDFMETCEQNGQLDDYVAVMFGEVDRESFIKWLAANTESFEQYSKWRPWNKLKLTHSICRIP